MRTKRKLKNQKGVTLLEVLVAMFITGFALVFLLNMGMIALDANDWSNNSTVAAQAMQEKLEEIRASQNFSSGSDSVQGITRSWSVSNIGSHLRQADVIVTWDDIKGRTHADTMSALVQTDSV